MTPSTSIATMSAARAPLWFWALAISGLIWNMYGIYQYIGSLSLEVDDLMTSGMTAEQAEIYLGLPTWISVVFAIGVLGGTIGCGLLLLRKAIARPFFVVSLAGYIALFAGDVGYGVFASIPAQLIILSLVVLIAVALLAATHFAIHRRIIA